MTSTNVYADEVQFESFYEKVLALVRKNGHASCYEMMRELNISYTEAVYMMDTLELRDIVDVPFDKGPPRPLLTHETRILKKERQVKERKEHGRTISCYCSRCVSAPDFGGVLPVQKPEEVQESRNRGHRK